MTPRESDLYQFIGNYQRKRDGRTPSYKEMCAALELKSKSGIHRMVKSLEAQEFIRRMPGKRRAILVVRGSEVLARRILEAAGYTVTGPE